MKSKLIKSILLLTVILLAVIGMRSTVYAADGDSTESGDPLYNYSFDLKFYNEDETPWNTNQYDAIPNIMAPAGTEYSYTWGNGQTGSGVTGTDRLLNINPNTNEANNTVRITLKLTENDARSKVYFYKGNGVYYSKTVVDGFDMSTWTCREIALDKDNVKEAKLYKTTQEPVKINVRFLHNDGTEWTLRNNYGYSGSIARINSNKYDIKYIFNNGKTLEHTGYSGGGYLSPETSANLFDASSATIYLAGNAETDGLTIIGPNEKRYSKVVINGTEVRKGEQATINFADSREVNLDFYVPETLSGSVSIQSYDGSLTDDFVWNFHFSVSAQETNFDPDTMYWTLDGEETKHMAIPNSTPYKCSYALDVQVPFGRKATLHNIPVGGDIMTSGNETWVYNDVSASNKAREIKTYKPNYTEFEGDDRYSYIYEFGGKTVITYRGEDVDSTLINQLGITDLTLYNRSNSGHEDEMVVDTSGFTRNFHWYDGFELNYYVFRKNAQIMFGKQCDENDSTAEKDKLFHFRVKLTDPANGKPLSGRIAYYTYTSDDEIIEDNNNVKYAELDENGYMDVYLKSGEYVKIGKVLTDEEIADKKFYSFYDRRAVVNRATAKNVYEFYFDDLGMLPYGVEYSVEEIDDSYDYTVVEENKENGVGTYGFARPTLRYTAAEFFDKLKGFKFINNRKKGTLTIEKIVEAEDKGREFKFNIKITDSAENFPLEYEYEDENGNRGTIKFTEGKKVTKEDREFTEYTANVTLKDQEKIIIKGIPAGAEYEVVEDEESTKGYTAENSGEQGKIKADDSEEKSLAKFISKEKVEEEEPAKETEPEETVTVKEETEEVKQVQTGDAIGKVFVTLALAMTMIGITLVIKRK